MAASLPQLLFWMFSALQVAGLVSAVLTRSAENRPSHASFQGLFLATMSLVALATVASMALGWTGWVLSASTLALMVVMAVWDPGLQTAS